MGPWSDSFKRPLSGRLVEGHFRHRSSVVGRRGGVRNLPLVVLHPMEEPWIGLVADGDFERDEVVLYDS